MKTQRKGNERPHGHLLFCLQKGMAHPVYPSFTVKITMKITLCVTHPGAFCANSISGVALMMLSVNSHDLTGETTTENDPHFSAQVLASRQDV
jgi:hypothetical protein